MGHGISWLSFLPGYQEFEHWLGEQGVGLVQGSKPVAQHVYAAALVTLILMFLSIRARGQLKKAGAGAVIPDPKVSLRNILEVALEYLYNQSKNIIGKDAARYFPVIGTLALFIFFSNILGLVPGFIPPTGNWNTTMACGGFVFLYFNYHGIRTNGIGHLTHMANPAGVWWGWFLAPLMFPIELVSTCARPFTLGIRLAANMVGDHAVLFAFLGLVPILVPLPFLFLGLLVSLIQTIVFVFLTMIYIALATAEHHHDEGHGEEAHAH